MLKIIILSITYCVLLVMTGCKKDETKVNTPEIEITSDFHFEGEIDGKQIVYQDEVNNSAINATSGCTLVSGCGCCISNQYTGLSTRKKYIESDGAIKLEFIQVVFSQDFGHEPTGSNIDDMFRVGTYDFKEQNGVILRYLDANGQLWGSDAGENASAVFEIEDVTSDVIAYSEANNFQLHKIIVAKIDCTLYPINNNLNLPKPKDKIELKNGVLRVRASLH
ncbi:hypothetical protein D770_08880 [Flammeovirgaceae bacterium 311]|nr:hypothetical protein D770_08880 [Flammeovirgaceae bacterium 311]